MLHWHPELIMLLQRTVFTQQFHANGFFALRCTCNWYRRERSRAVTAVFGGLDVGSAVGLVLCGPIIKHLGWPCVFYLFAVLGVLWTVIFPRLNPDEADMLVPSELQPDSPGKVRRCVLYR